MEARSSPSGHGSPERDGSARLPASVQIEIDSRCNLRCPMCALSRWEGRRERRAMAPRELEALLETHFAQATRVVLCGFSEPLMNPHVVELVRVARAAGKQVNLSTNGLMLTPAMARALVDAGLDDLALSFDTTRPETYRRVRGVDRLRTLVDNLRGLARAAERAGRRPGIELRAVVSVHTIREIGELVRFAAAEGVQLLTLIREMPFAGQDGNEIDRAFAEVDWTGVARLARELGVSLLLSDPRPDAVAGCHWAASHCAVSIEGDVSPCQVASLDDAYRFGNLREVPFEAIFASERYVAFRDAVARREVPAPCRTCSCVFRSGDSLLAP